MFATLVSLNGRFFPKGNPPKKGLRFWMYSNLPRWMDVCG